LVPGRIRIQTTSSTKALSDFGREMFVALMATT